MECTRLLGDLGGYFRNMRAGAHLPIIRAGWTQVSPRARNGKTQGYWHGKARVLDPPFLARHDCRLRGMVRSAATGFLSRHRLQYPEVVDRLLRTSALF